MVFRILQEVCKCQYIFVQKVEYIYVQKLYYDDVFEELLKYFILDFNLYEGPLIDITCE